MSEHVPGRGGGDIADVATTATGNEGDARAWAQATSPPLPTGVSDGFGSGPALNDARPGRRRRIVLLTVVAVSALAAVLVAVIVQISHHGLA